MTSNHLKPSLVSKHKYPRHAVDGLIKGTNFLGRTVVFGIAGELVIGHARHLLLTV